MDNNEEKIIRYFIVDTEENIKKLEPNDECTYIVVEPDFVNNKELESK